MRKILILLLLIVSTASLGQNKILYYADAPAGFAQARISKTMLEKDMQYWQTVMEESHVNPYHAISREQLMALKKEILAKLPDSITHAQACFAISELIGALGEGHLGFASNCVADSLYTYQAMRFPYLLNDIDHGAWIVQRDLSTDKRLPLFSRIISVNGIPAQQLYERYAKFYGGLEAWKKLMVKNNIRKLLYLDGIVSPFSIKAVLDRDTVEFTTHGYNREQADSLNKLLAAEMPPFQPFSLSFPKDNIALISFNTMNGMLRDSFSRFLARAFAEIKQKQPAGIVIDLRSNGGGDNGLGDMLAGYFNDKPYRNAGGMKVRISSHYKAYSKMLGNKDPLASWKDGSLYEYKDIPLMQPAKKDWRYTGKVVVLIGKATFSSANMFTNAIKDFHLATLIGESTAEPANDFGEIFSFMLPNTHIIATGAFKMFTRANGDEKDFNGIQPDIEVKNSIGDIRQKKDRVMEKAMEWINGQ